MARFNFTAALTKVGAAAAGGVFAPVIKAQLGNITKGDDRLATIATVAAGVFLTMQKNKMIQDAGVGMIGAMGADLAQSLGVNLNGISPRLLGVGDRRRHLLTPEQERVMRERVQGASGLGCATPDLRSYQNALNTL